MANPIDRGDFGIVFYASTETPLPTYVDINGQTQTAIELTGTLQQMPVDVASAYFHVGGVSRFSLQVDITSAGTPIDLGLLGHFDADPTAAFAELATFRNDDQSTKSLHTFADGGLFMLQTANLGAVVEGCIQAAFTGAEDDAEVIVRLRVER